MTDFTDIFETNDDTDKIWLLIKERFAIDVDIDFKELGFKVNTFHKITDLVDDKLYYSVGINYTDLYFQDSQGLLETLIKFIDKEIRDIPLALENLESRRSNRNFDDIQHFYDTEALSEQEAKLSKMLSKLIKVKKRTRSQP